MADKLGGLIVLGFLFLAVVLYLRRSLGISAQRGAFSAADHAEVATHIIEYADAFGEVTIRAVRIRRVYEKDAGEVYVEAFCLLRQEGRTFRADRILALQERSSGKMIESPKAYFDKWPGKIFPKQRKPSPSQPTSEILLPASHAKIMDRARAGLRIMIWLAKADRNLSQPEEQVMLEWVQYRAQGSTDAEQEWNREAALIWLRAERVTFADVERHAARMGQAEGARLVEMLENLMLADGEKCRLEIGRAKKIRALLPER